MRTIQYTFVVAAGVVLLGAGCSTYKDQTKKINATWVSGQAALAAQKYGETADKKSSKDSALWHLEAGAAYRAAGDFTNSNRHLEDAQAQIEKFEEQAKIKVASEVGATMSNQQNLPYEGRPYDKIMLHTYKALNYLALGDIEKARPEIIRAYQRQQDAVDENARRIEKSREADEKNKEKEKVDKARQDPKFSAGLEDVTKDLEGFKFYADYVNPFTVYLDALYYLHTGSGGSDLERAMKSFNRVAEVAGENKFVLADLQSTTNAIAGQSLENCTYVVFETGRAASLDQVRIDIPIIVTRVSYVGAAFPKLVRHGGHAPNLQIIAGDSKETTQPLASMDAIVALDFKNEFPTIVTKTLISTVAKAVAAYAVNKAADQQDAMVGLFAKLITAATQAAVNIADTRSWTTLPQEFQVARIPTPESRKLTLSCAGVAPTEITLVDGSINVVCAKSITATGPLLISQFKLK